MTELELWIMFVLLIAMIAIIIAILFEKDQTKKLYKKYPQLKGRDKSKLPEFDCEKCGTKMERQRMIGLGTFKNEYPYYCPKCYHGITFVTPKLYI